MEGVVRTEWNAIIEFSVLSPRTDGEQRFETPRFLTLIEPAKRPKLLNIADTMGSTATLRHSDNTNWFGFEDPCR